MMDYVVLSISSLAIVVAILALLVRTKKNPRLTTRDLLVELLRESNQVNRSLTHLVVSRDFQTYAGLQSLSQFPTSSANPANPLSPSNSTSEYIPRDDATEALRMRQFGAQIGYGEALFEDDPELAQTISEMVQNGQVDFGEGGI